MHVLGTPPAFVLSQDQTLRRNLGRGDHPPANRQVIILAFDWRAGFGGATSSTDWHQNRLTSLSVNWCLCALYRNARCDISSNRCASTSAWKLECGLRAPALAFRPLFRFQGAPGRVDASVRARRLFRHHRSGTTDRSCRVLHLQGVPTSGALRFEAECQPIGVFPARQTRGSMCSEPHRSAFPALAAEGQTSTGFPGCQLEIARVPDFSLWSPAPRCWIR